MIENPLLTTGLLLFFGYWGGRIANKVRLPRVSGYLVVGLLFSPSLFHLLSVETVNHKLHFVTEIALAIIAFNIGGSLDIRSLKSVGRQIGWITLFQALGALLITGAALFAFLRFFPGFSEGILSTTTMYLSVALIVGAISAATAPGAVLAVVSEAGARGEFTNILLGVIALDDALTVVFFSIAGTIVQTLLGTDLLGENMALMPFIEIGLSLLLGGAAGFIMSFAGRFVERKEAMLMVVLGVLFCITSISSLIHASSILSNMTAGFVLVNHEPGLQDYFKVLEHLEDTIFGLFFTLAGAHMDMSVLETTGLLALFLLVVRMIGKQSGVWLGARISNASQTVARYLGLALFPQAGVTIGLVLLAQDFLPEPAGRIIVNAVIGSVMLNEFVAPLLLHHCLRKAGQTDDS